MCLVFLLSLCKKIAEGGPGVCMRTHIPSLWSLARGKIETGAEASVGGILVFSGMSDPWVLIGMDVPGDRPRRCAARIAGQTRRSKVSLRARLVLPVPAWPGGSAFDGPEIVLKTDPAPATVGSDLLSLVMM